jgi:aspartyl-tRNA(Asn)/glutamyl-tRNA(Gln) amidotransferase subunit A
VAPTAADGLPAATAKLWSAFLDDVRALGAEVVTAADPGGAPAGAGDQAETWSYHQQFGPAALPKYRAEIAAAVTATRAQGTAPALGYIDFERDRLRYAHAWLEHFRKNRLDAVLKPGTSLDGATREDLEGITVFSGSVGGDYRWANYAGVPVALTPAGRSEATSMPFGVQVGGPPRAEAAVLQIVVDYQAHHAAWQAKPGNLP